MAAVREQYWIPQLRSLVKQVRKDCHMCRKQQYQVLPSTLSWKSTYEPVNTWCRSVRGSWGRLHRTHQVPGRIQKGA